MSKHWIVLCFSLTGIIGLVQAAPLSFNAALELAERQSPSVASGQAQIRAAQSAAIPADALPDPKLFAGVENYPVSGAERWRLNSDPMTMQKIGVVQEFPNADKRLARKEVASTNVDMVAAQLQVVRLKVRREAALAWLNLYYAERKVSLLDDLDRENGLFSDAVKAQIAGGRGQIADAVIPKQEAAQLADRRDDLTRDAGKARAGLRRLVGANVDVFLAGNPPELTVDEGHIRQHLHEHPELKVFTAEFHKAEADVHEASSTKKPDWGIELAFQRRDPQFGNMASVQFTFDLPISPGTRQDPLIAAKQQNLTRINAERDGMLRDHVNELENDLADYAALTRQLDRARQAMLPLAQEKVDLQTTSYKAGKVDLPPVLTARRELIEQRMKVIELENQRAAVAARLNYSYGEAAE